MNNLQRILTIALLVSSAIHANDEQSNTAKASTLPQKVKWLFSPFKKAEPTYGTINRNPTGPVVEYKEERDAKYATVDYRADHCEIHLNADGWRIYTDKNEYSETYGTCILRDAEGTFFLLDSDENYQKNDNPLIKEGSDAYQEWLKKDPTITTAPFAIKSSKQKIAKKATDLEQSGKLGKWVYAPIFKFGQKYTKSANVLWYTGLATAFYGTAKATNYAWKKLRQTKFYKDRIYPYIQRVQSCVAPENSSAESA